MEYLASLFLHLRLEGKIHSICVFFPILMMFTHTPKKKRTVYISFKIIISMQTFRHILTHKRIRF